MKENRKHKKIAMEHDSEFEFLSQGTYALRLDCLPHLPSSLARQLVLPPSQRSFCPPATARKRFRVCPWLTSAASWLRLRALFQTGPWWYFLPESSREVSQPCAWVSSHSLPRENAGMLKITSSRTSLPLGFSVFCHFYVWFGLVWDMV